MNTPNDLQPCQWARWLMRGGDFVVWDTETTGLETDSAIVSIGIINARGEVLLDTLINPCMPIPAAATDIHGITNEMVQAAPTFEAVYPAIRAALLNQRWVIYNHDYDVGRLDYECDRWGLLYPTPLQMLVDCELGQRLEDDSYCAMLKYADHYGDWSEWHGNYKWQKLTVAAQREHIETGRAHHALDDAMTTLNLIKTMAWKEDRAQR